MYTRGRFGLNGLRRVNNPFQDGLNGLTPYRVNPYPVAQPASGLKDKFNPPRAGE
jgi:hypothetical protein